MSDRTGPTRNGRPYDYGVPSDDDGYTPPSRNGVNGQNGQTGYVNPNGYGAQNGQNGQNGYGGPNGAYGGQSPAGPNGYGGAGANGSPNGYGGAPYSGFNGRNGGADGSDYYSGNYDYSEPYDYFGSSQARRNGAPAPTAPGLRQPPGNFPGPNGPLPPPPSPVSSGETMRLSAYSARLMDLPGRETQDERLGIPPGPSGGRAERRRAAKRVKRRRRLSVTKEIPILVGVALLIALVLKTFLVQAFVIPSGSMEQTIRIGDRVLVDKLTPWFGTKAERGDVVVFEDPGGWLPAAEKKRKEDPAGVKQGKEFLTFIGLLPSDDEQDLIKRVIAVGGDKVKCCDAQGKITVNGKGVQEPYINPGNKPSEIKFDVRVPNGRVFVMGDHRANSADSRFHLREQGGTVPEDRVQGRAVVIAWPFDHWGKLEASSTFNAVPESSGAAAATPMERGVGQLTQYPIPAELPLVMGVVGLSRLWDRRQWILRSECGGLGGRRSFRFRRERERGRERHGEGDP
ncbi:signal peptidase I [Streptomyces nanshensis]|uniref:signal peptidase I n=1 Tax=Streptomyces nanshensis TaxID=518642 RepID=UPI000AEA2AE0